MLVDEKRFKKYILKNGNEFIVTNRQDEVLRNGFCGQSSIQKDKWKLVMYDLFENQFNEQGHYNITEMSKTLLEIYPRVEYTDTGMRTRLRFLKETRNNQDLRFMKKITDRLEAAGLLQEYLCRMWTLKAVREHPSEEEKDQELNEMEDPPKVLSEEM